MSGRLNLRRTFFLSIVILLAIIIISGFSQPFNCYSIIVGKDASVDGSVIFAHNEDDYGEQLVQLFRVPRQKNPPGKTITMKNGGELPRPAETNSYLWFQMPTMDVSDSYFNEYGVVIASDACSSREDEPELTDGGIIYWLRRAMAEQARTAREAVHIAARLVEKYGYASSGRTYVIADANEGWMFAAVNGKHWVAQRVPDDHVAIIPNYYTIGEVDLSDTTNFLGSKDLIDYAIARGWYDPERDGKFNFTKVYSNQRNLVNPGNVNRMWRGVCLASGYNFKLVDEFPFSLKPKKKLSIQDVMKILRDHYEGTELDKTDGYKLGSPYKLNRSTICARHTQYGIVVQLRNWLPKEIGNVLWWAPRRPDCQAFLPIYLGTMNFPEGFAYEDWQFSLQRHYDPPNSFYDNKSENAFWAFRALADWIDEDYGIRIKPVREEWEKFENKLFKKQNEFEKNVLKIYEKDKDKALEKLTKYTNSHLIDAWEKAKSLLPEENKNK